MSMHKHFKSNDSRCRNCAAFILDDPENKDGDGECRRYAPRAAFGIVVHHAEYPNHVESDTLSDLVWPSVNADEFCCEWVPKT